MKMLAPIIHHYNFCSTFSIRDIAKPIKNGQTLCFELLKRTEKLTYLVT